jgi:hypothetical protein
LPAQSISVVTTPAASEGGRILRGHRRAHSGSDTLCGSRIIVIVKWTLLVVCAALMITGCKKDIDNNEAVRQGVIDYLNTRSSQTGLNMTAMDVTVSNVSYANNNNEATATVSFVPKGTDAGGGMSMTYVLERRGDKWVVKGRGDSGADAHGGEMPSAPEGGAMPPNHPPVEPSGKK